MPRYIDADDLLRKLCAERCGNYGEEECAQPERCYLGQMIEDEPTVDAEPVRHGRWMRPNDQIFNPYCSCCLTDSPKKKYTPYYCPNCGAKMDLEEKSK